MRRKPAILHELVLKSSCDIGFRYKNIFMELMYISLKAFTY